MWVFKVAFDIFYHKLTPSYTIAFVELLKLLCQIWTDFQDSKSQKELKLQGKVTKLDISTNNTYFRRYAIAPKLCELSTKELFLLCTEGLTHSIQLFSAGHIIMPWLGNMA